MNTNFSDHNMASSFDTDDDKRRAEVRRQKFLNIIRPTAEEDAAITAGAKKDLDNPLLVEGGIAQFKPPRPRGRPVQEVTKVPTTMRLDSVVLDSLKAMGDGWQTRVNAALYDYLSDNHLLRRRYRATIQKHEKNVEQLEEFLVVASSETAARDKVNHYLLERGQNEAAWGDVWTVDIGNARINNLEVIY